MVSKSQKYITESYCAQVFGMREIISYQTTAAGDTVNHKGESTAKLVPTLQPVAQ